MAVQLTITLPETSFSIFREEPDRFARELLLAAAVKWYEMGKVSQSKAAELTGLSRTQFLDVLARFEVSPFQTTSEELMEEAANA